MLYALGCDDDGEEEVDGLDKALQLPSVHVGGKHSVRVPAAVFQSTAIVYHTA